MVSDDDRNGDFFNNDFEYSEHDIKTPHDGQTIDLDQIVKTRHPLLNKKAKWKLNDIFNLEKIEAPIYLSSLSERTLTDITNQENNHIVPTHIQKFNQELSKLDNYTKDKDINSLYVIVLTFFEEIGQRYNLESVADDFPCLSFVIDFHDPYGKLDSLYRKYFGINYKDIEIYQSYDIFHVNKHLDKYIKESIEKDLLAIPDDYGGLDKIYFELAERSRIKKTHFKTKKDTLMDEGTWMKLTIDAFFYSMIKFFDDNLVICWGERINKTTKGANVDQKQNSTMLMHTCYFVTQIECPPCYTNL
ncbi:10634_t:CDS:2 [Entrophospora sp. SA101]|nr:10634_t:CDS:2 [Entrophospora sp. SA101]